MAERKYPIRHCVFCAGILPKQQRRVCSVKCLVFSYAEVGSPDQCWNWQATKTDEGYGRIHNRLYNGCGAHRASFEANIGPIPEGLIVCHRCDNPSCVNPDHLFLGTNADNSADRAAKGRTACGEKIKRKLTDEKVREIKSITGQSARSVARKYGVTHGNITAIWRGEAWKHIA